MKIKKLKKRKKYYSEKTPTKLSWHISAKSDTYQALYITK